MAAVIRLKRHLDDEPLTALILNCKKRKKTTECETNDTAESESETSTVLTFAGTINNQEDDITSHISKLTKEELETSYKKHVPNITSKLRYQTKVASDDNRFKIVNLFRSIPEKETTESVDTNTLSPLTVLDVESSDYLSEHTDTTQQKDNSNYVYDLYYTNSEGIDDNELDTDFKICPANEIIFDDGLMSDSDGESDDSNDENNWRNDYPDEESNDEDEESVNEDDMQMAINNLKISDDLSSDDDRIGFTYSIDSEAMGCEEDIDPTEKNRYGEMFARFKRGQKREEEKYNKDLYHEEIDDTDDDFYDD